MSLSDIMAAAGLSSWAEVALVLSFLTFSAITAWVLLPRVRRSWEQARLLPLDDDGAAGTTGEEELR